MLINFIFVKVYLYYYIYGDYIKLFVCQSQLGHDFVSIPNLSHSWLNFKIIWKEWPPRMCRTLNQYCFLSCQGHSNLLNQFCYISLTDCSLCPVSIIVLNGWILELIDRSEPYSMRMCLAQSSMSRSHQPTKSSQLCYI